MRLECQASVSIFYSVGIFYGASVHDIGNKVVVVMVTITQFFAIVTQFLLLWLLLLFLFFFLLLLFLVPRILLLSVLVLKLLKANVKVIVNVTVIVIGLFC